jgi:hypothetical protein
MEVNHTAGEWRAEGGEVMCGDLCVGLAYAARRADGTLIPSDETLANARLMAAAPGLLEALRYVVANAEAQGWSEFMLNDARTAIAKAEGSAR